MGWFGDAGRWIGTTVAELWHKAVDVWHEISPIVNEVGKEFGHQVGPVGISIIKAVINEVDLKDLSDASARKRAYKLIVEGFQDSDIFAADRWINFGIELFVNAKRERELTD